MIEKSTLKFLSDLKQNNNRDWFLANKASYESAKKNFTDFVQELINNLSKFDKGLKGIEAKKCVFRINRDIRFSSDKSPYKSNMGASFSAGGKNSNQAGYYIHIEGNKGFLAGGRWMPEAAELAAIRQEIDYNTKAFKKILSAPDFVKFFGEISQDDKLKTAPKGYAKDHPELELLKLKSFIADHYFKANEITNPSFQNNCVTGFKTLMPLNAFLNKAIGL
jgi:uncharacterized protein (TIGR02453 family)